MKTFTKKQIIERSQRVNSMRVPVEIRLFVFEYKFKVPVKCGYCPKRIVWLRKHLCTRVNGGWLPRSVDRTSAQHRRNWEFLLENRDKVSTYTIQEEGVSVESIRINDFKYYACDFNAKYDEKMVIRRNNKETYWNTF